MFICYGHSEFTPEGASADFITNYLSFRQKQRKLNLNILETDPKILDTKSDENKEGEITNETI